MNASKKTRNPLRAIFESWDAPDYINVIPYGKWLNKLNGKEENKMSEFKIFINQARKLNVDDPNFEPKFELLLLSYLSHIDENAHRGIKPVYTLRAIKYLSNLLKECHVMIQDGIYSEDGIDYADKAQDLLDRIENVVEVERSHRSNLGYTEI